MRRPAPRFHRSRRALAAVLLPMCIAAGSVAMWSCSEDDAGRPPGGEYRDTGGTDFTEGDLSPWMAKADQQLAYERRAEGSYFAFTEGRCNGGLLEFRHVAREFPAERFREFGVFWGLNAAEFYRIDLEMQKNGFVRANLQVFEDGAGNSHHQAVWLLPKE